MAIKTILITGATGYIGGRLAAYFIRTGIKVAVIVRKNSDIRRLEKLGCIIFEYNGNYESLDSIFKNTNIDAVLHLAAISGYTIKSHNISAMIDSNINFGTNLLEAMVNNNCKNFVNTSTYWQYSENEDYLPNSLYAASKKAFEDIIDFYSNEHKLAAISLVLFDVYGEQDDRTKIFKLIKTTAKSSGTLEMTPGEQEIVIVDIEDVISAYDAALKIVTPSKHKKYFVYSAPVELKFAVLKFLKISELNANIIWGAIDYRSKQIMKPYLGERVPNWKPKVSLEATLRKII